MTARPGRRPPRHMKPAEPRPVDETPVEAKSLTRKILGRLTTALVVLVFLVVLVIMIIPAVMGLQRYVITGGSMTGTIPKGAVIYSHLVPTSDLKAGDIITFVPPGQTGAVTHRILGIKHGQDGKLVYETKGDFNDFVDPWKMNLEEPRQARYGYHIPLVGYALILLSMKQVRFLIIGLPAIAIAISMLVSLWRAADPKAQGAVSIPATAGLAVDPIDHDSPYRA